MRLVVFLTFIYSVCCYGQIKSNKVGNTDNLNKSVSQDNQRKSVRNNNLNNRLDNSSSSTLFISKQGDTIAPIDSYLIYTEKKQSTHFDTILSIQKQYEFNYLRKDIFGLLPFGNDGQTYQSLTPYVNDNESPVSIGFTARKFSYFDVSDINYYHVPTPVTELLYRSVTGKGQNLDALLTLNTSEKFNMFVGYRGLRSQGKYVNQLTSNGNFRLGSSYLSTNKKYRFFNHVTFQDMMNDENGGLVNTALFESSEEPYNNRETITVQSDNSSTLFKGLRGYFNHSYQLNNSELNKASIQHRLTYEYISNLYQQQNVNPFTLSKPYLGQSFASNIYDKVRNSRFQNNLSFSFDSNKIGLFTVGLNHYLLNHRYTSIVFLTDNNIIPSEIEDNIISFNGSYFLNTKFYQGNISFEQSFIGKGFTKFNADGLINISEDYKLGVNYKYESKLPNYTYQLFQSGYYSLNWFNDFANEKISYLNATIQTPWVHLEGSYHIYTDKLYFSNDVEELNVNGRYNQLVVSPKQYDKSINHLQIKAQKEFKFNKWALDNTFMFQHTIQDEAILNLPKIVTRNTIYYQDFAFSKALFFQTGIVFNYFTKYYANEYHPVIGDFVVQDKVKIGGFPMFDFFLNAKIKTAHIYLNIDHFNSKLTGYNYYTTPTYPYRDLTFRIGMKWNFFN